MNQQTNGNGAITIEFVCDSCIESIALRIANHNHCWKGCAKRRTYAIVCGGFFFYSLHVQFHWNFWARVRFEKKKMVKRGKTIGFRCCKKKKSSDSWPEQSILNFYWHFGAVQTNKEFSIENWIFFLHSHRTQRDSVILKLREKFHQSGSSTNWSQLCWHSHIAFDRTSRIYSMENPFLRFRLRTIWLVF